MKEGYKKTELGIVPIDWNIKKLDSITKVITKGTTPTTYGYDFVTEGINFIKIESIDDTSGTLLEKTFAKITEECHKKLSRSILEKEDILFAIAGATVGKCVMINEKYLPANTNQALAIIRIDDNLNKKFIFQQLRSPIIQNKINNLKTNTAQPNLNLKQIGDFEVIIPTIEEQEKIVDILSIVDSQIDDTDKINKRTKELKKGLMQRLFTKGIGHKEFKKSEVGEIPVEWEVKKIGDIVEVLKSGLSRSLKEENIGIPCLRSNNIKDYRLDLKELKYWYELDPQGASIDDYILNEGDILVNFINSISQIGKGCIFNKLNFKTIYTTNLLRIKVNKEIINNSFFHYYTQMERYKREIMLITKPAVNQASFTTAEYKLIKFPIPKLKEQEKIVNILSSIDTQIEEYENVKTRLEELKKGLMQQLLTGEIRVR